MLMAIYPTGSPFKWIGWQSRYSDSLFSFMQVIPRNGIPRYPCLCQLPWIITPFCNVTLSLVRRGFSLAKRAAMRIFLIYKPLF
jgi:hypothetical protein